MLENLSTILNLSTQWKDFFWIIFTLVAALTSLLTYLRVRKTIRQFLYDKVIEAQIDVYTRSLEILDDIASITVYGSDEINHGEIEVPVEESTSVKKTEKDVGIGSYRLINIRSAHFHVPSFQEIYGVLQSCMNNIFFQSV